MRLHQIGSLVAIAAITVGCATHPRNLPTTYISPYKYRNFDCHQLEAALSEVLIKKQALEADLSSTANYDAVQMTVGLVVFWPALFLLEDGDSAQSRKYSDLKGEYEAIVNVGKFRNCDRLKDIEIPKDDYGRSSEQYQYE